MTRSFRFLIYLLLIGLFLPGMLLAQQRTPTVIFSPVKVDSPPHDPANDSYWFGPFSETSSVLDVDNDGDMDIVAGRNWYEAPLWIKHEDFRPGGDVNGPETENNSEFAMDVDGDGCTDIVSSGWMFMKGAYWYKNPCNKTDTWESTKIHQGFNMEGVEGHHDIDGDGDEDILVNHWALIGDQGLTWLEHVDAYPYFVEHVIGHEVDSHGNGMGDVNMDGRTDFVTTEGWYENPGGAATKNGTWTFHHDWSFRSALSQQAPSGSHPLLVHDVNKDGLNDIIIGSAHAYGLAWFEQQRTGTNGGRAFEQHWIETDFSQFHTVALGDINGDGEDDLVAGRRLFAHYGDDIGAFEPLFAFWYDLSPTADGGDPIRHIIFYNHLPHFGDEGSLNPPPNYAFGVGMNVHIVDMNDDGRNDVVTPGKAGLYIFYNQGSPPSPANALLLPPYDTYDSWREWTEYQTLFNGRDFSGWTVPQGDGGHWTIDQFVIDYDAESEAPGEKHLMTSEDYCDFNLHVEWRIKDTPGLYDMPTILPDGTYETDAQGNVVTTPTPNADSGILLRGMDHQVNIWNWPVGSGELWSVRTNENLSPALRAAATPSMRMDHPIGEWNEYDIRLIDDRASVMLNGEWVITDAQIPGIADCGPIGLQHHGGIDEETGRHGGASSLVQFRNIWIDEIDDAERMAIEEIEQPEGWDVLFDTRTPSLDAFQSVDPDHSWVIEDGVLTLDREFNNEMINDHYLWTKKTYGDFVLEYDFRTFENTNSGVFIRTADLDDPVYTGIEVQVANSYGAAPDKNGTAGTLYDIVTPDVNAVNPPGEWNHARVIAADNQIVVELNGRRVLGADLDQWTDTGVNPDGSPNKFHEPMKDFARVGYIGLQDHGQAVEYRDIRVMRMPTDWEVLLSDESDDLEGWITGPDNAFVVENGVLTVDREYDGAEHNQDYLWTADTYDDFILELEFRTADNTNSGVFIRTADVMDPVYTGIEAQVANSNGDELTRNGTAGTLYDLTMPTANPIHPPGEWNTMRITAKGRYLTTEVNGQQVAQMDLEEWQQTGMNPDGSENKFTEALTDFARTGHIGLQDHGRPVWYRNIRVKRLQPVLTER